MSKTRSERPGLLKNANYRRLLGASAFGAVSAGAAGIGLDLVAVITLQASAFEVGLINAVGTVSYLVLSVPVGVLVDRMRKSAIMGFAELLAAVALLWTPVAFMLGILEYWQLLLVTFVSGFAGMLFSIASRSVLPDIVDDDNVALAYSRQESATTAIDIVAPFVVGQVLRWVAAPFVLLISSVARVISSILAFRLRGLPERVDERAEPYYRALGTGLRFSLGNRPVRLIVISTALINFGLAMGSAVETIYYVRTLEMSAPEIGVVLMCIGIGGLAGTLIGPIINKSLGERVAFRTVTIAMVPVVAILPLIAGFGRFAYVAVAAQGMLYAVLVVVYNVNSYSLTSRLTPRSLIARQMSFLGFAGMGVVPIASLLGGFTGTAIGAVSTLWIWVGISVLAVIPTLALPDVRAPQEGGAIPAEDAATEDSTRSAS